MRSFCCALALAAVLTGCSGLNSQLGLLDRVLNGGAERGDFKPGCDRFLVFMSILSLTYFYRANLYTLSSYLGMDLAETERRKAWLSHVQIMIHDLFRRRD